MLALKHAAPAILQRHRRVQLTLPRRTFFKLPELPSLPNFQTQPQTYTESRVLPYSQKELYAVVADVASYPRFVPFCTGSRIDPSAIGRAMKERTVVEADLSVGFLNFSESYTSVVTCDPFKSVQAVASSSTPLFKTLSTEWRFAPSSEGPSGKDATLVSYKLQYEFSNPLHAAVSSSFFSRVSELMIKAFDDRCAEVYRR